MPNIDRISGRQVSRRDFLNIATVGTGAVLAIGLTSSPAQAKVPQKVVNYQSTPKGKQSCATCGLFVPQTQCKLVDGTVAPQGWCSLYQPKA
jgi:anaerobic selenocysteine-containing dehydrogenase